MNTISRKCLKKLNQIAELKGKDRLLLTKEEIEKLNKEEYWIQLSNKPIEIEKNVVVLVVEPKSTNKIELSDEFKTLYLELNDGNTVIKQLRNKYKNDKNMLSLLENPQDLSSFIMKKPFENKLAIKTAADKLKCRKDKRRPEYKIEVCRSDKLREDYKKKREEYAKNLEKERK